MDSLQNPYQPGPGLAPPLLAGREKILAQGRHLWERLKQGQAQNSLLLLGLRGSGKTRLLRALAKDAELAGLRCAVVEAHFGRPLALLLVPALRSLLLAQGNGPETERILGVLNAFSNTHTKLPAKEPVIPGQADSGDLESDLAVLMEALGLAAKAQGQGLLLCVDEAQALDSGELSALLWAQHRLAQAQGSMTLVLAGLPFLESLSEAERGTAEGVFETHSLEALDKASAASALESPAQALGARFEADALAEILRQAKGLPYHLQLWGSEAWDAAEDGVVRREALLRAAPAVARRLDAEYYGPSFKHLSPREKNYLRSMAHLGPGPRRSSDIADSMDAKITALGPLRARLIKQGLIYSPAHGLMAFAMPGYDDFMRRVMPNFR
jgi:hypothetical protein